MAKIYTSLYYHVIFSTRSREPWLSRDIEERVWMYLGTVARQQLVRPLIISGADDHVHLLISVPASLPLEDALQRIKTVSAAWIRGHVAKCGAFEWQEGYGAFTVSRPQLPAVEAYIRKQREHHQVTSFMEEYTVLLNRNGVRHDPRCLWD